MSGRAHAQRGVAALTVTALLLLAMLIVVTSTQRSVGVETRASANQLRSSQAFEAAEAGLEWALARLNDDARLGDDCLPSSAAGARSLRERVLVHDAALPGFRPATWNDAGTVRVQLVACQLGDPGWSCSCPGGGVPILPMPSPGAPTTASFSVAFSPGPRPDMVGVRATGCSEPGVCLGSASTGHDATAAVQVGFGLLPGLRSAPVAALTVRGNVDAGTARLDIENGDAAVGGVAIHAGGRIDGASLRLFAPPGASLAASLVSGDGGLAELSADRFFARWFGMTMAAWSAQPAVMRIACAADCTAALQAAIADGHRLLAIAGDATVRGAVELGRGDRPVVIVVAGTLRLEGDIKASGVMYAGAIEWRRASSAGSIHGAAISEAGYTGDAEASIVRDAAVLAALRSGTGTFARIGGSWKDF
ncbi:MAG: PilX N-terminal domain-containing pilus assembly protein [Pseudomonadota bacterium]|nr:PilX N-terminal domain-containing pilus assembly protein [Pseudomonadota bacterium]